METDYEGPIKGPPRRTTESDLKSERRAGQWWCRPLIPELGRQRQADLYEFKASLGLQNEFQDSQSCYIEKFCLENIQTPVLPIKPQWAQNQGPSATQLDPQSAG